MRRNVNAVLEKDGVVFFNGLHGVSISLMTMVKKQESEGSFAIIVSRGRECRCEHAKRTGNPLLSDQKESFG